MGLRVRHAETPARGWLTAVGIGAGVLTALAVSTVAAAAKISRMVLVPPRVREQDVKIVSASAKSGRICFSYSKTTSLPGRYGLWFSNDSGHAKVGEVIEESAFLVERELLAVDFGDIEQASRGRFSGWLELTPADLGYKFEEVELQTDLGPLSAWSIPAVGNSDGQQPEWAIQIHGRASTKAEGLRAVDVLQKAGYSSLLISYRNDPDASRSDDNRYGLGSSEWKDVDSALRFVASKGAKRVVLMGWSMGGAIAFQASLLSELKRLIVGIVLDSPVVDWYTTLDHQGREMGFRGPLRALTYALISSPWGRILTGLKSPIDLDQLNLIKHSSKLKVPILILHSTADDYVPASGSIALAEARPDLVTLELFDSAAHARIWNLYPTEWNKTISNWLGSLKTSA